MKKLIMYISAVGLLSLVAPSCGNHEKDSKEAAEESNDAKFDGKEEKDADYLANAYLSNLFETEVSKQAMSNANTGEVKDLAKMLADKHTAMNEYVSQMATEKSVTLPAGITDEQQKKINKLAEKTGIDYDKEYTSMMKDKHEDAIKTYEKISEKAEDPAVREWAAKTLPEVRSHLDMVKAACDHLKDMK